MTKNVKLSLSEWRTDIYLLNAVYLRVYLCILTASAFVVVVISNNHNK